MIRPGAETKEMREEQAVAGYSSSIRGMWVAGIFCLLVLGLLFGNRATLQAVDPMNSPQLKAAKTALANDSQNDQLKQRIRGLDASLRREYLRRLAFANQGSYVLLVGVGLFLIAGASALSYRKKLPAPAPDEPGADKTLRTAALARKSVAVFGAVAALSMVGLAVFSQGDLTREFKEATRGYTRVEKESKKTASAAQQAASAPSAPAAGQPAAGAAAPAGTGATPSGPVPPIGPLPVTLPPGTASNNTGTTPSGGSSEQPKAAPVKLETVPFDESDYKPTSEEWAANWPIFRGPLGTGFLAAGDYPTKWDAATGEGILWKTAIPLPGLNSPVVWGDRVFLAGADKDKREIYCVDANSGKMLWTQGFAMISQQAEVMEDTGYAPSTMAVDGKRVFAIFPNGDLVCMDFDGKQIWSRALGVPENTYGHASSLTMYGSLLFVLFDQGSGGDDTKSLLLALQGGTGKCIWYAQRTVPNSWATPIVCNTGSRYELVTAANPWMISYDPVLGREYWRASFLGGDVAPSPIFAGGMVLGCNMGACLAAVKPGEGDITSGIAWKYSDSLPDITSPVGSSDLVFMVDSMGTVTCIDLKTGTKIWDHSLQVPFRASPTIVGSRLYLSDDNGLTHILSAGRSFVEEATSPISEKLGATPAFVNNRIYIRGDKNLYCVGRK